MNFSYLNRKKLKLKRPLKSSKGKWELHKLKKKKLKKFWTLLLIYIKKYDF
jgi:hypothetical protein